MAKINIPFFGLDRLYAMHKEEFLDAIDRVYSTGQVLDGPYTKQFERAMALRCDRKFAIAVNSCTQALEFTLRYDHIQSSKTVALPAISFAATYNSAITASRKVKFVDVDRSGLIDMYGVSPKEFDIGTIVYVNLYGNMVDYHKLKVACEFFDRKKFIVEDAAQSLGGFVDGIPSGKCGDVSCLSFDPTKNLPNFGSGGMVLTDNIDIYNWILDYRANGKLNDFMLPGTNSRMSEADCSQMLVKLKYFDQWQERRADIAKFYTEELHDVVRTPVVEQNVVHAWHKYVIHTTERSELQAYLTSKGIETKIHYERMLPYLDSAFELQDAEYTNADAFTKTCLSLPIYPEMTDAEVEYIVTCIQTFYETH